MAVLPDADRFEIWAQFMRDLSVAGWPLAGITKTDLRDAANAADDWVNANAASYNSALPVAFRTNASLAQKVQLLMAVISWRFKRGV